MQTPAFYDQVRRLSVYDPLAEFLGAAENAVSVQANASFIGVKRSGRN